jgi:uncharacterized membrane protein YqgA involved in biofilm formation
MITGTGTALNVAAIVIGSGVGVALGERLPERTRDVVTDGLGLLTLLVAALTCVAVKDAALIDATGKAGPVLVVLGAILIGGIIGSLLRLESRVEDFGHWLRAKLVRNDQDQRFVEGFVSASLVFCIGPLAILGSISDGLGNGIDQLALKAALDGFASIAFAAALGWGVAASALSVAVYQGLWTLVGVLAGGVLPPAEIAAMTVVGGILLVGVSIRLLRLRDIPVADLLPAVVIAPLLTALIAHFQ